MDELQSIDFPTKLARPNFTETWLAINEQSRPKNLVDQKLTIGCPAKHVWPNFNNTLASQQ
jgi:hypothetical protein